MTSCPGCGAPDDQGCYLGCPELDKPGIHKLNLDPPVIGAGGGMSPMPEHRSVQRVGEIINKTWNEFASDKRYGAAQAAAITVLGNRIVETLLHDTCEHCRHWKRIDAKKIGTCQELSNKMMGMYVVESRDRENVVWWTLNDFGCVMFQEGMNV
jgi:hypothetical protein